MQAYLHYLIKYLTRHNVYQLILHDLHRSQLQQRQYPVPATDLVHH